MDFSYEDLERYLLRIFTGEEVVSIKEGSNTFYLLFRFPDNNIKVRANLVYDMAYDKAISEGLLSMEDLEDLIQKRNLFTEEDQLEIEGLESKLEAQRVLLSKTTKVKANADRIKKIIHDFEVKISNIKYKKYSKLMLSANTKAEEERQSFLCNHCTYSTYKNELFWPDEDVFNKETRLNLKNLIVSEYTTFYNGLPQTVIRAIARHNLWRIRYVNSLKVSESLFGRPGSEYTNDQLNLAYWSNYYQSIYEMMPEDRPSDMIIDDDESLDAYMTSYYEEKTREDAARRSKKDTGGKMSAFDKEEVIVTKSNELYEDISYDKPREAQRIKDKSDIKKKANKRSR